MRLLWPLIALLLIAWAGVETARGPRRTELAAVLEAFLDARLRRDEAAAHSWLTPSARRQFEEAGETIAGTSNPHWTYFALRSWNGVEALVTAHEGYSATAYASYREERLTWGKVGGKWRIVRARFTPRHTLRASRDGSAILYEAVGAAGAPGPRAVLRLADLPAEFTPAGASPEVRFGVGRARFGPLAFSPVNPSQFAFSSGGVHGFVGLATLQGFQRGLDLYFEGDVVEIRWSADDRYLMVDVLGPSSQVVTTIYDVASGARLPIERIRAYPSPIPSQRLIVSLQPRPF